MPLTGQPDDSFNTNLALEPVPRLQRMVQHQMHSHMMSLNLLQQRRQGLVGHSQELELVTQAGSHC